MSALAAPQVLHQALWLDFDTSQATCHGSGRSFEPVRLMYAHLIKPVPSLQAHSAAAVMPWRSAHRRSDRQLTLSQTTVGLGNKNRFDSEWFADAGLNSFNLDITGVKVDGIDAEFQQRAYSHSAADQGGRPPLTALAFPCILWAICS